jgi:histone H3/H4
MANKKHFAFSPVRDLMKSVGAQIVARDAVEALIAYLETVGTDLTTKALKFTRHGKRAKLTRADLDLAMKI